MKSGIASARHEELAQFLMTRRSRLQPEMCGLPASRARRRTPGLRREDVSAIAGISTAYYTWIEQGRIFDISIEVLSAIASALRLDEVETAHVYTLAGKADPGPPPRDDPTMSLAVIGLREEAPGLTLTPWLEIIEANWAAKHVLEAQPGANLAMWLFAPSGDTISSVKGDSMAVSLVVLLRRNRARDVENPHYRTLIEYLYAGSSIFRLLWDAHLVDLPPLCEVEIVHHRLGRRNFRGALLCEPVAGRWFVLSMAPSPP